MRNVGRCEVEKNQREKKTIRLMIAMFCRGKHGTRDDLCNPCRELAEYAVKKLEDCPYKKKPKCKDCKVHCYDNDHRKMIKEVMGYSGKRMLFTHPVAALLHQMGMSE